MDNVVLFGQCLGDPLTLRLLGLLRHSELCICEMQSVLRADRSVVDLRLRKLRNAGLVKTRSRGQWFAYRLNTRYAELIEKVFEAFDNTLDWDPDMATDKNLLVNEMQKRIDGWCPSNKE